MKVFEYVCFIMMGFIILLAGCILLCSSNINKDGLVVINGEIPLCFTGNDMEPFIKNNDLIIVRKVALQKLMTENVVAYFTKSNGEKTISIGRIKKQDYDDEGNFFFYVKSDKSDNEIKMTGEDIIGKWEGTRVLYAGGIFTFLFSQNGFLFGIVTPFIFLFIFEACLFLYNSLKKNKKEIEVLS